MALDKILASQKQVTDYETLIRDLQKQILQNQHQLLSKDSILARQKLDLLRANGDESSVICDIRQGFSKDLRDKDSVIEALKTEIGKLQANLNESQISFSTQLIQVKEEKVTFNNLFINRMKL